MEVCRGAAPVRIPCDAHRCVGNAPLPARTHTHTRGESTFRPNSLGSPKCCQNFVSKQTVLRSYGNPDKMYPNDTHPPRQISILHSQHPRHTFTLHLLQRFSPFHPITLGTPPYLIQFTLNLTLLHPEFQRFPYTQTLFKNTSQDLYTTNLQQTQTEPLP